MSDQDNMIPTVGVIIVGWNNDNILGECFESVKNQTYSKIKTIYWDNDSKDKSVAYTQENFPWVDVVESDKNIGFAAANNKTADILLQDEDVQYIVLLNSDARIAPNWIQQIVDFAKDKPKAALIQGKTLDYYDHDVIDSTHVYLAQNGQATQGSWRNLDRGVDHPMRIYGVNAAACVVTTKFIKEQPFNYLFDEKFFMYLEDVDIAARALVTGWDNYYVPTAVAYHMGSASSGKNPGFSLYMTYRNNLAMVIKNYPTSLVFRMLYKMFRSDISTFRRLVRQGKKPAAYKLVKGRIVGFFRLPLYTFSTIKISRARTIDKYYLWKLMSKGRLG